MGLLVRVSGLEDPGLPSVVGLLKEKRVIVVEGEPGSGKTTFSIFLAKELIGVDPVPWLEGQNPGDLPEGTPVLVEGIDKLGPGFQDSLTKALRRKKGPSLFLFTMENLDGALRFGRIKRSLYSRLGGSRVELSPLRERKDRIPFYAGAFLSEVSKAMGKDGLRFDAPVLEAFRLYSWPGNLRELREVVGFMAASSTGGVLGIPHLPRRIREIYSASPCGGVTFKDLIRLELETMVDGLDPDGEVPGSIFGDVVSLVEETLIRSTLEKVGGVKTRAARLLGINRNTLSKKIKEYGIDEG